MTAYSSSVTESLATIDTVSHRYIAVRNPVDSVGRAALGILTMPLLFPMGGTMEHVTRVAGSHRPFWETLTVSDSVAQQQRELRLESETLATNDAATLQQSLIRRGLETLVTSDTTIRPIRHFARGLLDQVGNDRLVSPMLLFPIPRLDVVTRVHGSVRTISATQITHDALLAIPGFVRSLAESYATVDSFLRHVVFGRRVGDTLVINDAAVRRLAIVRTYLNALAFSETLGRRFTGARSDGDSVGPAAAQLAIVSMKPRSVSETLITRDAITLEQLLGMIMGYLWTDALGNVQGSMPDWEWYLAETPSGNSLNVIEVPAEVTVDDLTREK